MEKRNSPPSSAEKKKQSTRTVLTETVAVDLKAPVKLSHEVFALKKKLDFGGQNQEIPNLINSVDQAKSLFSNLNTSRTAALQISQNAIGTLKNINPQKISSLTILAFRKPNGQIAFVDENDKKAVVKKFKNGVNSRYLIEKNSENIVLCYRNPRGIVYVPYSPQIDTPQMRAQGIEYLTQAIEKAKQVIAEKKVLSRSQKGKLVTDVVPAQMIANLMIIEHVDPPVFKRAKTEDELKAVYNSVLIIAGGNKGKSYNYSGSSAGAFGFAQFMPATYKEIQGKYPKAELIVDFKTAMQNHVNAIIAMYCLLDSNLLAAPINCRKVYQKDQNMQALYLGSCYNGGAGRTNRNMREFGDEWRENLPEETRTYLDKIEGFQNPKGTIRKRTIEKSAKDLKKMVEDVIDVALPFKPDKGQPFKIEKNFQEGLDKKKSSFTFPSGLKLPIATDKVSKTLWFDPSKTPLQYLKEKFPQQSEKNLSPSLRSYLQNRYTNNVPIVKVRPEDLEKPISKYFKLKELLRVEKVDKAFMEKTGSWQKYEKFMIQHTDGEYYWNVARIDPNLCKTLDAVREKAGISISVDEGVRPYAYNRDMYLARYGKPVTGSPHISGRAVDLSRTGNARKDARLISAIREVLSGVGGGIGIGSTVYHIDVKINNGKILKNGTKSLGNWILDKSKKVVLRTREWPY